MSGITKVKQLLSTFMVMLLVSVVGACTDAADSASSRESDVVKTVVKQSQMRAGGAIAVKTRVLGEVVVNQVVTVELSVVSQSSRGFWLTIADSDQFELLGDSERFIEGGAAAKSSERIELIPLSPGKHYLRMTVSREAGDDARSVVVALKVKDESGTVPDNSKPVKNRIEFRSQPVQ